jgi:hypothetical protein
MEETLTTTDGIEVYWQIEDTRISRQDTIYANRYKISLSIKARGSNAWDPEVEFYPLIAEVTTNDANDEPQIDKSKIHAYLLGVTDGKPYAQNWRLYLFGNH